MYTLLDLQSKTFGELRKIGDELNVLPKGDRRYRQSWIDAIVGVNPPLLQLLEASPAASAVEQASEAIEVQAQEAPLESKFGRIVYPQPAQKAIAQATKTSPGVEVDRVDKPIAQAVKTSPGVEVDLVPDCSNCFGDGYVEDKFGLIKFCQCETEPKLSHQKTQRAIAPATKESLGSCPKSSIAHQLLELFTSSANIIENSPGVKAEVTVSESAIAPATKNPILTGVTFSDRFLARYAPPQTEILHFQPDADGQLSLLNFEIESVDEPPDPDDFNTLEAFREAIARWDREHPIGSDQLPNSQDNDVSTQDKPLELSNDSFCLWAHCPAYWYEPVEVIEASKVMEMSPTCKSSSTSDFYIPTFDGWGDSNRSDEPPDMGIFAKLPKPTPPKFPPQTAATWRQLGHKLNTTRTPQVSLIQPKSDQVPKLSRNYPETIPKLFHRVADTTNQPARSPPGGDA